MAPYINAVITDRGMITGLSVTEATQLSQQLNFGRLPVALKAPILQNLTKGDMPIL